LLKMFRISVMLITKTDIQWFMEKYLPVDLISANILINIDNKIASVPG
jgi:hypothetical protein